MTIDYAAGILVTGFLAAAFTAALHVVTQRHRHRVRRLDAQVRAMSIDVVAHDRALEEIRRWMEAVNEAERTRVDGAGWGG